MYHVRSPGKANLIGGHTDYSGGFALSMATDLATTLEAEPAAKVTITSEAMGETRAFGIDDPEPAGDWTDYVRGCYAILSEAGYDPDGFEGTIGGDLPLGKGLGSSASLELAVLAFLGAAYDLELSREDIARLGRRVETEFLGVDHEFPAHHPIALSKADEALFLDLGSETYSTVSIPTDLRFLVVHSGIHRELADSPFADRRETVRAALAELGAAASPEVDLAALSRLDGERAERLGYVVRENARVRQAATALDDDDVESFGEVLVEAHEDLAEHFDATTPELDWIVETAVENDAYGARMIGPGWGGAAIIAVDGTNTGTVADTITREYPDAFPDWELSTYAVDPADGVTVDIFE
ncbi:MAG: galactokinase family protein [Halapricum sp.]